MHDLVEKMSQLATIVSEMETKNEEVSVWTEVEPNDVVYDMTLISESELQEITPEVDMTRDMKEEFDYQILEPTLIKVNSPILDVEQIDNTNSFLDRLPEYEVDVEEEEIHVEGNDDSLNVVTKLPNISTMPLGLDNKFQSMSIISNQIFLFVGNEELQNKAQGKLRPQWRKESKENAELVHEKSLHKRIFMIDKKLLLYDFISKFLSKSNWSVLYFMIWKACEIILIIGLKLFLGSYAVSQEPFHETRA